MTGDRPTTPGWHCHRCRSTSCRQRADSDTDHVGRVEYRPLLLTQPSSVSWLWSHTHWCPSQRPQEVMRVDGSANPTMPIEGMDRELTKSGDATHLATDGPAPRRYDGDTAAARVRVAVFVRSEYSNALVGDGVPGFRRARRTSTAPLRWHASSCCTAPASPSQA